MVIMVETKRSFFVPKQVLSNNKELQHLIWQFLFFAPYTTHFSKQSAEFERCLAQCKFLSKLHL